jgi:hypothetical protein
MKNRNVKSQNIQKRNICNVKASDCQDCAINGKLMCSFNIKDTIYFVVPVFGGWAVLLAGIVQHYLSGRLHTPEIIIFFVCYSGYLIFFFLIWENKILCSHCPYYSFDDESYVKCYANYGIHKAWKYNPAPMSRSERIQFMVGILIFAAYPLVFLAMYTMYIHFAAFFILVIIWIGSMHFLSCSACPNFSCPLNNVDEGVVKEYLRHNKVMGRAWDKGCNSLTKKANP